MMFLKKLGPDRFSRFHVYWIQTNKQTDTKTDKQTDKPNVYIDFFRGFHLKSISVSQSKMIDAEFINL